MEHKTRIEEENKNTIRIKNDNNMKTKAKKTKMDIILPLPCLIINDKEMNEKCETKQNQKIQKIRRTRTGRRIIKILRNNNK